MKRRIIIGLVAIVLIAGIAVPTVLYLKEKKANAENLKVISVQVSFLQAHGGQPQILGVMKSPEDYVIVYQEQGPTKASVISQGKWLELGVVSTSPSSGNATATSLPGK